MQIETIGLIPGGIVSTSVEQSYMTTEALYDETLA